MPNNTPFNQNQPDPMQTETTPPPAPQQTHVMLDLETLGTTPGSVILSIGAVKFGNGQIISEFYCRIDPKSSVAAGLKMDPGTVLWWLKQNDEARKEICEPGESLGFALHAFAVWLNDYQCEMWGNGAGFDNVLLSAAYDIGLTVPRPWKYSGDRCYRTVKNANKDVPFYRLGTAHNALDDAKSQALHLMAIWEKQAETASNAKKWVEIALGRGPA